MTHDEPGVFPHDLSLDPGTRYFLYVGEARYDSLNQFMREALERRTGFPTDCVRIVPDVTGCNLPRNTIVLNPRARDIFRRTGVLARAPMTAREFAAAASASETVRGLVRDLAARQGEVYVHVAESVPELTLGRLPGVRLIGPDGEVAAMWNNRLYQARMLKDLVPVLDQCLCRSPEELEKAVAELLPAWEGGACLLAQVGGDEAAARVAADPRGLAAHAEKPGGVLLVRHVASKHCPTVLGITAGKNDVFIAAVADRVREPDGAFGA